MLTLPFADHMLIDSPVILHSAQNFKNALNYLLKKTHYKVMRSYFIPFFIPSTVLVVLIKDGE